MQKKMEAKEILTHVDHTLLTQTATWEEIRQILDDAMKYDTASACIPASYVKAAAEYVDGKLPICTVIALARDRRAPRQPNAALIGKLHRRDGTHRFDLQFRGINIHRLIVAVSLRTNTYQRSYIGMNAI